MIAELESLQNQFSALLGIAPEKLRGLQFCQTCHGIDYQWTDGQTLETDFLDIEDDLRDYRAYLSEIICQACDGTGFQGGSWKLAIEDWLEIGYSK